MNHRRARAASFPQNYGDHLIYDLHAMEKYLASIGLGKKVISPENSLYRAISDEVYFCQTPEKVGFVKNVIEQSVEMESKMKRIREGDEDLVPGQAADRIQAAANIFEAVIRVFKAVNQPPVVYYPPDRKVAIRQILLCETRPNHFERVVHVRKMEASAQAKVILYDAMYKKIGELRSKGIKEGGSRVETQSDVADLASQTESTSLHNKDENTMTPARSVPVSQGKLPFVDKTIPFPIGMSCLARTDAGAQRARVIAVQDAINRKLIFEDATVKILSIYELRNGERATKKPSEDNAAPTAPQLKAPLTPLTGGFSGFGAIQQFICEPLWNNSLMPPQPAVSPIFATPPPDCTGFPMTHPPPRTSVTEEIMHNYSMPPVGPTIEQQQNFMANYSQPPPQQTFVPVIPVQQNQPVPNCHGQNQPVPCPVQQNIHHQEQHHLPMSPAASDMSFGDESVFGSNEGHPSKLPAVPYFNEHDLSQVSASSSYSSCSGGNDLPDVLTTRYYFNLGVNYARRLKSRSSSSLNVAPPPHMIPKPPPNFVMQQGPGCAMPSSCNNSNQFSTPPPAVFVPPMMPQPVVYTPIGPPHGTVYFSTVPAQQEPHQ